MHVHAPDGQLLNEQFAPWSHCSLQCPLGQSTTHVDPAAHASRQPPLEQSTVHVAPLGHDVLHPPAEQSTVHVPSPQYVRQCPLEQAIVQSPLEGQVSWQLPLEQSIVHGAEAHAEVQLPAEQPHVLPPLQLVLCRAAGVPGSDTAGPPFGVAPPVVPVVLEPPDPQAMTPTLATERMNARTRMENLPRDWSAARSTVASETPRCCSEFA